MGRIIKFYVSRLLHRDCTEEAIEESTDGGLTLTGCVQFIMLLSVVFENIYPRMNCRTAEETVTGDFRTLRSLKSQIVSPIKSGLLLISLVQVGTAWTSQRAVEVPLKPHFLFLRRSKGVWGPPLGL